MDIETQYKIKQAGLDAAQGSLLLACALVALPATIFTTLTVKLGEASVYVGGKKDKGDGARMRQVNTCSLLTSVYGIAKGFNAHVSPANGEGTTSQAEEPAGKVEQASPEPDVVQATEIE